MVIDVDLLYARFFLKFSEGCTSIVLSLANLAKVRLIFWLFTNKSKQSNRVLPVNKKRKLAKKRLFESAWFRFQQFEIIEKHFRKSYLLVDTWGQFLSTLFSFKDTYSIGCFASLFVMNFKSICMCLLNLPTWNIPIHLWFLNIYYNFAIFVIPT